MMAQTIKETVEDITKNRKPRFGKVFKNLFTRDKHQLKWIVAKPPLLSSDKVFDMSGNVGAKKDKMYRVLCDIRSVKNLLASLLHFQLILINT